MEIMKTFRFPSGSVVLYSHPDCSPNGEIILFSGKKIVNKFFIDVDKALKEWDTLCEDIRKEILESVNYTLMRSLIRWTDD